MVSSHAEIRDSRSESRTLAILRLLVVLGVLIGAGDVCLAQNIVAEADRAAVESEDAESEVENVDVDDERKQRTAATAMATLFGIALAGILLLFIVVLLGARTRRMAHSGTGGAEASKAGTDESTSADDAANQDADTPDEDEP